MHTSFSDSETLGKFLGQPDLAQHTARAEELKAAYERISELEDLARNVAGLDLRLIHNAPFMRELVLEWREQAGELLS